MINCGGMKYTNTKLSEYKFLGCSMLILFSRSTKKNSMVSLLHNQSHCRDRRLVEVEVQVEDTGRRQNNRNTFNNRRCVECLQKY